MLHHVYFQLMEKAIGEDWYEEEQKLDRKNR